LSHLAVRDPNSALDGRQSGGISVSCTDNLTDPISINSFFGLDPTGTTAAGTTASNFSMTEAYGYSSSSDLETFIYAGKLEAKLVIPKATLTGTYYKGKMRLGQFFNSEVTTVSPQLTVSDLVRASDETQGMRSSFTLHSSMVNDYILTHTLKTGDDILTDYLTDNNLGSEIVDYIVLQSPAVNITTGLDQVYSMICTMKANAVVLPSAQNLLLYRTFTAITHHKQHKEMDYSYAPVNDDFLDKTARPISYSDLAAFSSDIDKNSSGYRRTNYFSISVCATV